MIEFTSKNLFYLIIIVFLFDIGSRLYSNRDESSKESFDIIQMIKNSLSLKENPKKTLLMYAFFSKNENYNKHLQFFLDFAIRESDPVDYVIIIQGGNHSVKFPVYKNLRVVRRPNTCYDFGAYGDVIKILGGIEAIDKKYKAVMFLNPSAPGPIIPKYWPSSMHWTEIFTSRLKGNVHALGSSITCLPNDFRGFGPGLEGYATASTPLAISIAMKYGVFDCRNDKMDVITYSEYGLATSLLKAGLNIDTNLLKYENLDWRNTKTWDCNDFKHPTSKLLYEGIAVHPLESVFQKVSWDENDEIFYNETYNYMGWAIRGKSNI